MEHAKTEIGRRLFRRALVECRRRVKASEACNIPRRGRAVIGLAPFLACVRHIAFRHVF